MSENRKPSPEATGDQEVPAQQDLSFQIWEWRVQRAGWIVMTLIVIAALLGLTGAGPLASASDRTPDDALQINYSRLDRVQSPGELEIDVATSGADRVALWLANDFLDTVTIETITPNPVETRAGSERQVFVFAVNPTEATARVRIGYQHDAVGMVSGTVGVVDGPELEYRQFVYP